MEAEKQVLADWEDQTQRQGYYEARVFFLFIIIQF